MRKLDDPQLAERVMKTAKKCVPDAHFIPAPEEGDATACDACESPRDEPLGHGLSVVFVPEEIETRQGRRVALVRDPFFYVQRDAEGCFAVLIPPEYQTDFASVPRPAHWAAPPIGNYLEAAVMHDWLYTLGPPGRNDLRQRADRMFAEALKDVGVPAWRRVLMSLAVRAGGGRAFGRKSEWRFRDLETYAEKKPDFTVEEMRTVGVCPPIKETADGG